MRNTSRLLMFILVMTLALSALFLSACNGDETTPSDSGITVSGRITLNGQPLEGVSVSNAVKSDTTNGYGIFVLRNLSVGDVVTFELEGYTFSPSSYEVTASRYDLNVTATATQERPEEQTNPEQTDPNEDNPANPERDDPSNPDDSSDDNPTSPEDDPSDPSQPDNPDKQDDTLYNCTNGALQFKNNQINFVFCANKNYNSLSIEAQLNGNATAVSIDNLHQLADTTIGNTAYNTYMIDVTEYAADGCRFTASASNKNGKGGATASAVYRKTQALSSPCNLIAKGTVLSWECSAPDAKFHVIVDGIIVAETGERSYDFSTIVGISFTNKKHSVYVTAEKSGYYTAISNTIEVTFGEENERI